MFVSDDLKACARMDLRDFTKFLSFQNVKICNNIRHFDDFNQFQNFFFSQYFKYLYYKRYYS